MGTAAPRPRAKATSAARRPRLRRTPNQSRAQETVEAILGAARRILVKQGLAALTTNKVAELAGVSIGSLYQYFPNKDALLAELQRRHMEEGSALVAERLATVAQLPPREAVRAMVVLMIELHRQDPALHRALVAQVPKGLERLGAIEAQIIALVTAYLGMHAEVLRVPDHALAAAIIVQTVEALTHGAVLHRPELLASRAFEDEVVELVVRYLVRD